MTDNTFKNFSDYVTGIKPVIKRQYDRNINIDLSQHKSHELFKRNVGVSIQQAYQESLLHLLQLAEAGQVLPSQDELLNAFDGFIDEMLEYALQRHRTSCALSNFADEHQPSQDYIVNVLSEAQHHWQGFTQQVNKILLDVA